MNPQMAQMGQRPRLLTARQAAERAGVRDKETIKQWVRELGYTWRRLGYGRFTLLFPEEIVDLAIARHTVQVPRIGIRGQGLGIREKEFQV